MAGLKTNVITWTLTLTFPVVVLFGVYFFFSNRFDRNDIGEVKEGVSTNARELRTHGVRLDSNAKAIANNAERIDGCEEGIAENSERIGTNEAGVAGNKNAISALDGKSQKGREGLAKRLAELQAEVKRLQEKRAEEESFRKDTLKRMDDLQKEIRELTRRLLDDQDRFETRLKTLEDKAKGNPE